MLLRTHNSEQDVRHTQEDHRARFFEYYRREADDYDREFLRKYDENLNTTIIFVSLVSSSSVRTLKGAPGWSVLCGCFCIHHQHPIPTPARHG